MKTREDILSLAVDAMEDAASGMRYVRENYGDLSGVGFDRVQEKYLNVISKLRAAPTPPAAEAPGQEPVAVKEAVDDLIERLLDAQQDINLAANQHMDQSLCDASALIDEVEKVLRSISTPPTYADAEAKGLEKAVKVCPQCEGEGAYADGLDEAACSTSCTRCDGNGWIVDVAAIRSLASPAPKEPGQ